MVTSVVIASLFLLDATLTMAEESTTVIGPSNIFLYDGANALMAGDGEEGVRLTLVGLEHANSNREKKIAHSNLCAGYLLMEQPEPALKHCNWVLERDAKHWRTYNNRALVYMRLERFAEAEDDIRKGQELRPHSKNLKVVKGMYLDKTQPVTPKIEADDRRSASEDLDGDANDDVGD